MQGRRFNDGLHQAIEAKEGVKVAHESKTLATITFQNYFRLYSKLSGMTGTALTEEDEFREIYKLDVIAVPTNKPIQRIDHHDQIYRTEKGKFEAVINQVIECNKKGQPVLVGTISIEKSEILSKMLKAKGIKHNVLNAKQHEREAEIVAQAGKLGAVTIATNMAGRGTDIILGGNAEFAAKAELRKKGYDEQMIVDATGFAETDNEEILAARKVYQELYNKYDKEVKEKAVAVKEAGGLFIIGTERHESRRIDNQLRGRSGRQGDCGESRFFLSVEDDLMRIFAGDRLENMMKTFNVEENMSIESKTLTKIIESSQKKIEARNFSIRKNVLNYDDVMSKQRETIYEQRAKVLNGEDLHEVIIKMMKDVIERNVDTYLVDDENKEEWNLSGLREHLIAWATTEDDFKEYYKDKLPEPEKESETDSDEENEIISKESIYDEDKLEKVSKQDIKDMLTKRVLTAYEAKEKEVGSEMIREVERVILLKIVDNKWTTHIDDMDELKKGIGLRAYGQRNPVVEYRYEGFEMFDEMIASIQENTVRMLSTIKIQKNNVPKREPLMKTAAPSGQRRRPLPPPVKRPDTNTVVAEVKTDIHRNKKEIGDNDMCPCGSGRKYVKCCKNKQAKG
jgi:preprotein translocase subunit SecA